MIKIEIRLDSTVFNEARRRQIISNWARKQARDLKNLTKQRMLRSKPAGRLYRRRSGSGFQRFHQASAYGQRPAIDTGNLLNSITDRRLAEFRAATEATAAYAKHLQGEQLNRPIISDLDKRQAQSKANRDAVSALRALV